MTPTQTPTPTKTATKTPTPTPTTTWKAQVQVPANQIAQDILKGGQALHDADLKQILMSQGVNVSGL
jgi:hypothetical protein